MSYWLDDLKQNILLINKEENGKRRVYGENNKIQNKTLRKSYFSRPKLLTDWEYKKQRKNQNNRQTKDIQVLQFSQQEIQYDKEWNKLKYEHKINRIIHYVKSKNLNNDTKKELIQLVKSRKIQVEYVNGEIKNVINLEENN